MYKNSIATALLLAFVACSRAFAQSGIEACFIDVPPIDTPTRVFSRHISKTSNDENAVSGYTFLSTSRVVSFDGGMIELDSTDTSRVQGINVWGDLVFESGAVEVTDTDGIRVDGIRVNEEGTTHFKDGRVSVSSVGGSFVNGVYVNRGGNFVLDGGTIEVTAGSGVFQPRGVDVHREGTAIINGGTIRVDGGSDSNTTRGIYASGHPSDPAEAATVIINGGTIETTGGSREPLFLEASRNSTVCMFGGSVGAGSDLIELNEDSKLFIFGSGFNWPMNTPITEASGTITGTLLDGNEFSWSFERRRNEGMIMLVPEPSTVWTLLLGMLALIVARRRK